MATEMTPEQAAMSAQTDEQKVRERWPDAYCRYLTADGSFLGYQICDPKRRVHGYYYAPRSTLQLTEAEAWHDAAARVERGEG